SDILGRDADPAEQRAGVGVKQPGIFSRTHVIVEVYPLRLDNAGPCQDGNLRHIAARRCAMRRCCVTHFWSPGGPHRFTLSCFSLKLDYERKAEQATRKGSELDIHDPLSGRGLADR